MPSGEALARQMIFGQRFFESRFGIRCETAWLPDSFGLTGALPQLIRLAGMDNFFTQKLSWCVHFLLFITLLCLSRFNVLYLPSLFSALWPKRVGSSVTYSDGADVELWMGWVGQIGTTSMSSRTLRSIGSVSTARRCYAT